MTNSTIESVDFDGADLTDAVLVGAQVAPPLGSVALTH